MYLKQTPTSQGMAFQMRMELVMTATHPISDCLKEGTRNCFLCRVWGGGHGDPCAHCLVRVSEPCLNSEEPLRKLRYTCSYCRTGVVLLLVQFGLVELAAEITVACSNLPPASSSLCHYPCTLPCPLSLGATTHKHFSSCCYSFLLAQAVSPLHLSHIWESTTLARLLPPAIQYTKERAPACLHFRQENMYQRNSGKKLLDASVTNAVRTVQPPQCLQRHTYSYEEGKLQRVISFPAEICN